MARAILVDEFHLSLYAPSGLPEDAYLNMRKTIDGRAFQVALRHAVITVLGRYPSLRKTTVRLSR